MLTVAHDTMQGKKDIRQSIILYRVNHAKHTDMSAHTLFTTNITLEELTDKLEALADMKCSDYYTSFGSHKSKTLARTHTAMLVGCTKSGDRFTIMLDGENEIDLKEKALEFFERLKP
ncbi:MAG: hypothetical protein ACK50E_06085 [Bacteroidota bacterium]